MASESARSVLAPQRETPEPRTVGSAVPGEDDDDDDDEEEDDDDNAAAYSLHRLPARAYVKCCTHSAATSLPLPAPPCSSSALCRAANVAFHLCLATVSSSAPTVWCVVLCCVVLWCGVLWCVLFWCSVFCCVVLCCVVLCCDVM